MVHDQQQALEAMSARWPGELDRWEQQASADGSTDDFASCTRWLSETLKVTPNQAYAQVRTAGMLEQLPQTATAFRRGEFSSQHVAVIRRAIEQVPKTNLEPPSSPRSGWSRARAWLSSTGGRW